MMANDPRIPAIVLSDAEGVIRYWSDSAEQLFGYLAEEAQEKSLDLIVPPEYRDRHGEGFRRAMATGRCESDREAINLPVWCKGGSIQIFPARLVFLQDARGNAAGALVVYSCPEGAAEAFGPMAPPACV